MGCEVCGSVQWLTNVQDSIQFSTAEKRPLSLERELLLQVYIASLIKINIKWQDRFGSPTKTS